MVQGWLQWRAWAAFGAVVVAAVCAAGVALGDIGLHFAWQAWHLATSTCNLPGRRGAYWHWAGSGGGLPLLPHVAATVCVAGVALGDIDLHFAWQAWRLATSTCILCGRCGAYGTGLAPVARLGRVWRRCRRGSLCGRRGAWRHRRAFCLAGVALMVLGWLRWRACAAFGAVVAAAVRVADVPLGDIDVHSAWQLVPGQRKEANSRVLAVGHSVFLQRGDYSAARKLQLSQFVPSSMKT